MNHSNIRDRISARHHTASHQQLLNVLDYSAKNPPFPKATPGKKLYTHPAIFALCFMLILSCAYMIGGAA